jgi:hypothetical protein
MLIVCWRRPHGARLLCFLIYGHEMDSRSCLLSSTVCGYNSGHCAGRRQVYIGHLSREAQDEGVLVYALAVTTVATYIMDWGGARKIDDALKELW